MRQPDAKEKLELVLTHYAKKVLFAGDLLSIYNDWKNKIEVENIKKLLGELFIKIEEMNDNFNIDSLDKFEFLELVNEAITKTIKTTREHKISMFSEFLAKSTTVKNRASDKKFLLLESLDKIDLTQLELLKTLNDNRLSEKELKSTSKQLNIDYLTSIGLLKKEPDFHIDKDGHLIQETDLKLTLLSEELLNFLRN